jgi:hypothetical protein
MNTIQLNPQSEKITGGIFTLGGSAIGAISLLAAKSIIPIGIACQAIPIVGTIIGIALLVLGMYVFYHAWQKEQASSQLLEKPIPISLSPSKPSQNTGHLENLESAEPIAPIQNPEQPSNNELVIQNASQASAEESTALTSSDKLLTAGNLVQWALIGASYAGFAPTLIMPLSVMTSLGSEFASFWMLPKDASWLRKAMSIPVLSKIIINYNPWVAKLFQATSLYNIVESSVTKLRNAWNAFQNNQTGAIQSGATHLFNLASSVAFATGLVRPKPPEPQSSNFSSNSSNFNPNLQASNVSGNSSNFNPKLQSSNFKPNTCPPKALVNLPCNACGMFSVYHYLLGAFDKIDKGDYSGAKVDFEKVGPYYDPARGSNWFEYYFNPIDFTDPSCSNAPQKPFSPQEYGDLACYAEGVYHFEHDRLPPDRARYLVEKYFPLKPEIQKEIDQFANQHFSSSDYVVGVHYRGTDKTCNSTACEARRVGYDEMTQAIHDHMATVASDDQNKMKIFVASDEQPFVDHLKQSFPGKVIASPSKKSTNGKPLHLGAQDPYQSGKEALIDANLLAKLPNVLIRTSSNLSKFSSLIIRQGAKVIEVSKRFYQNPSK